MSNDPLYSDADIASANTFGVELPVRPKPITLQIELTTDQIRFLIDSMWSMNRHDRQSFAIRHNVNDVALEGHLQECLSTALNDAT